MTEAFLVDDIDGGLLIECEACFRMQPLMVSESLPKPCAFCKEVMHYPEGASW